MTEIKVDNVVNVAGSGKPNFPVSPTHSSGSALSTLNTYQYDTTARVVTVVNSGGNKYAIDGVTTPTITLLRGVTYVFDMSDSSNAGHPLAFKNSGSSYTTGVVTSGTAGQSGATVKFTVAANAPLTGLTYYCTAHGDSMGASLTTSDPKNGALVWDSVEARPMVYINSEFKNIQLNTALAAAGIAWGGARGFRFGGYLGSSNESNVIDYWAIDTAGNAQDFGDLTSARYSAAAASSGTRAIVAGGYANSPNNIIDYITCATTGNATDFGDMSHSPYGHSAVSDSTRASIFGGYSGGYKNTIEYITIASAGNATDQCDMVNSMHYQAGWNDATRGVIAGGESPAVNVIQYFTIQSTNNAQDFGDLTATWKRPSGGGDSTRSCFMGGRITGSPNANLWTDTIEYVTTQTLGNSADFGNLTNYGDRPGTSCDGTYCCVIRNEYGSGGKSNVIDRFTVQTLGNATDFGDITENVEQSVGAAGNAS